MKCKYPGYEWCSHFGSGGSCGAPVISTRDCPGYDDEAAQADAHSCRACADAYGVCQQCGAVIYGTSAYYHLYGGE